MTKNDWIKSTELISGSYRDPEEQQLSFWKKVKRSVRLTIQYDADFYQACHLAGIERTQTEAFRWIRKRGKAYVRMIAAKLEGTWEDSFELLSVHYLQGVIDEIVMGAKREQKKNENV